MPLSKLFLSNHDDRSQIEVFCWVTRVQSLDPELSCRLLLPKNPSGCRGAMDYLKGHTKGQGKYKAKAPECVARVHSHERSNGSIKARTRVLQAMSPKY